MNSIMIRNTDGLVNLLAWRDQNKDVVRSAPIPQVGGVLLTSGAIFFASAIEIGFKREGAMVSATFTAGGAHRVSFDYDFNTWQMTNVQYHAQNIPYPQDMALQDILTVYASTMAYIAANGADSSKVLQDGTEFEILA